MQQLPIYKARAHSILSPVSGFLKEAGFTHSLNPSRNCTFACTYCYVPTMRIQAGLKPEDWEQWGKFTTFKENAAELLDRELRAGQILYCSPLVDPYQPAEAEARAMPAILEAVLRRPPRRFVLQTRGPLILRDIELLCEVSRVTILAVSFSLTTDSERIRRWFEPWCAPIPERLQVMKKLSAAGIRTFATLAPLLPCDPERLAGLAMEATRGDLIGDPLHVRAAKPRGATTWQPAHRIAQVRGFEQWLDPAFQSGVVDRIAQSAARAGRRFVTGPEGFGLLADLH
ncbi:MAG: radical SAM protein [Bryobacteraceae bacterium]|nr:radical SAM protein [Bryobacteraceae bacterium]